MFSTGTFLKRTDTLSTIAYKRSKNHFDTLVFLNARFDTRVSVFKERVFAHLSYRDSVENPQLGSKSRISRANFRAGSLSPPLELGTGCPPLSSLLITSHDG